MNDPTLERDPIETLASEFTERLRAGERPTVQEYIDKHPHVADEIRDLFPTIAAMEGLKGHRESRSGGRASLGPTRLTQLGDFRIVREIGRGGMGIVYEAEQLSLGRRVAVKVLPKQSLLDEKHLMRFRREAKTAARLHHTNIVPVLGVGEHDGFHFIVMQYIRGVGLDELIPQFAELGNTSSADSGNPVGNHTDRREAQISSVARAIFRGKFHVPDPVAESSIVSSAAGEFDSPPAESGSIGFEIGQLSESTQNSKHRATKSYARPVELAAEDDLAAAGEAAAGEAAAGDAPAHADPDLDLDSALTEPDIEPPQMAPSIRMNSSYWRSVATIGAQVASALQYAHEQGTLHRDIKPANLLIDQQGIVWVADFGLAKAVEQDDVSRTGDVVGTLRYMAPEQFFGNTDRRSDLFSLGLTLYELLTFRPAYDETDRKKSLIRRSLATTPTLPRRLVPGVPRDLETIVLKAMAEEPERRYATGAELAEDLERFLEDRPILARRATPVEHLWRLCRRNPAIAALSGIAASLLILVAIVSTTGYVRTTTANRATIKALAGEKLQRQKAEATSELAWDALDRIFARFAPESVVSVEPLTVETEEGDELAVESPVVLSDQAAALLEELLTFYDLLAAHGDNDVAFQRRIADANRRVGAIQQRLGRDAQATEAYRRAIKIYNGISTPTDDPLIRVSIGAMHNELASIFKRSRKYAEAVEEHRMARNLLESLARNSNEPAVQYELARTYYLQSGMFFGPSRRGRSDPNSKGGSGRPSSPSSSRPDRERGAADRPGDGSRGEDDLSKAIALLEDLDQQRPNTPDYQQLLAMTYVERAKRGDAGACNKAINSAVAILNSLVERFPNNPDFRFAQATAYATETLSERDEDLDQQDEEIARLSTSLSILKELQREHPNVPEYAASEAKVAERLGKKYARSDDFDQAMTYFETSIKTQAALVRRHPTVNSYTMRLSFTRQGYASELRRRYEVTKETALLETAREQLAITMHRTMQFMRSPTGDPRMKSFVAFGILNNYKAIVEMSTELGDEEGAAAAQAAAEGFRAEFDIQGFNPRGGPRGSGPRTGDGRNSSRGGGNRRRPPRPSEGTVPAAPSPAKAAAATEDGNPTR